MTAASTRKATTMTREERELLATYRALPPEGREFWLLQTVYFSDVTHLFREGPPKGVLTLQRLTQRLNAKRAKAEARKARPRANR